VAKKKLHILITAGGTREYIDPVRYISNASTGKMGYALARAAVKAGHTVTLVTAPTPLKPPAGAKVIDVVTSGQMLKTVKAEFDRCDCLIMAAAVSDYKPATSSAYKIKKEQAEMILKLMPTQDILKWAGQHKKKHQIVVGFALEDKDVFQNAEKKLADKHLDMIVANEPAAIAADTSTIHIKTPDTDWQTFENIRKSASAASIIKRIEAMIL
jgi:phosphopantothenoylcysteine decarboxylase/phosphopantothenate--cysteine ligase